MIFTLAGPSVSGKFILHNPEMQSETSHTKVLTAVMKHSTGLLSILCFGQTGPGLEVAPIAHILVSRL